MWRSAEALFNEELPLGIWNRSDLEPATNRVRTWLPRKERISDPENNNVRKQACPQGHPYNEANTYRRPSGKGGRECVKCRRKRRERTG
jgi:hypothetical protein